MFHIYSHLLQFLNIGASFISNVVGFVYPMYATIKTIENPGKEDELDWLIYWVVFATICVIENFIDFFIYFIPFYYPLKVSFLLWCMLERFKGSKVVYDLLIKPLMSKVSAIDAALDEVDPKAAATKID